jgi:hypothetical protein
MKKPCAVTLLAFLLACNVSIQGQPMGPELGKYRFLSESGVARIPFQPGLSHIVVTAEVNGTPGVQLILDTGMPMPGLILVGRKSKDQMNMNFIAEIPVSGGVPREEPVMVRIAEGVSLEFPGLELTDITTIVEPLRGNLGAILGDDDGIIGFELFGQFAVTIDYDKHEIVLAEPGNCQVAPDAEVLPFTLRNGLPWLECSAEMIDDAVVPLDMVVDVGASHALSLNVGTYENLVPPDNAIDAILGRTVSGEIHGKVGRIKTLHLGDLRLENVVSSFQTGPRHGPSTIEKHGNLGNGVFQRFNVTFDYVNQRMILIPNSHFDKPFEYNMSGVMHSVTATEPLRIIGIVPGSSAAATALKTGDIITHVNGRPCDEMSRDELRSILTVEGATVRFEATSPGGTAKDVTLTLRRII